MATLLLSAGAKVDEDSMDYQYPSAICQNCGLNGCSCRNQHVLSPSQSVVGDEENPNPSRLDEEHKSLRARHSMPLFLALKYGTTEMVQILLKAGSRVKALPPECRERLLRNREDNVLGSTETRYSFAKDKLQLLSWYTKCADFPSDTMNDVSLHEIAELTEQIIQHFREGNVLEIKSQMGSGPDGRPFLDDVTHACSQTFDEDILLDAVKHHRLNTAALLLEKGYDPNARDHLSSTGLHVASAQGDNEMVMLLLQHGANVDSTRFGATPLRSAVGAGRASTVKLLLKWGANPNGVDGETVHGNSGNPDSTYGTPLKWAVHYVGLAREQMIGDLIRSGADVNVVREGTCLLENAIYNGSAQAVMLLLDAGALIHKVSLSTMSELRKCAETGEAGNKGIGEAKEKLQLITTYGLLYSLGGT